MMAFAGTVEVRLQLRGLDRTRQFMDERNRARWIGQRVYQHLRSRNAGAVHRMHDMDGPPYPWDDERVDLDLELFRVRAGIEYDTQRIGRRIAMAYTDSMAALLALEARYHDQCVANPLT